MMENGNGYLMTIKGEKSSCTLLMPKSIEDFPHPKEVLSRNSHGWDRKVPWGEASESTKERVYARYTRKHYQRCGMCVRAFMAKPKLRRRKRKR